MYILLWYRITESNDNASGTLCDMLFAKLVQIVGAYYLKWRLFNARMLLTYCQWHISRSSICIYCISVIGTHMYMRTHGTEVPPIEAFKDLWGGGWTSMARIVSTAHPFPFPPFFPCDAVESASENYSRDVLCFVFSPSFWDIPWKRPL